VQASQARTRRGSRQITAKENCHIPTTIILPLSGSFWYTFCHKAYLHVDKTGNL
jgi:hypothetical protein